VIDDTAAEAAETVIVTLTPNVPVYTVKNPSQATVTIADDEKAGFIVSAISNNTSENGATATFTVTLASKPKDDVTIPVTDLERRRRPGFLGGVADPRRDPEPVFTAGNWDTPQTVTVHGSERLRDGPVAAYQIDLGPTTSNDTDYDAKTPPSVGVINDDNEPEVTITATTPNAAEPNVNGVFTVARTGDTAAPLTVNYTVGGTATAGADFVPLSGSVTIPAGFPNATITVTVVDDFVAEGPETVIVTLTPSGSAYTVKNPSTATVTIAEDDVAGFEVTAITGHTNENGGTATFTIRLTSQPTSPVTIPVASTVPTEGTPSPSSLLFTALNWNIFQTVTVTGQNDIVTDALHSYQIALGLTSSADLAYDQKTPAAVDVINDDNEPEVTILATTPNAAEPNVHGQFTVFRTGDPSAA
jgi:hypothetical protein